MGQKKQYSCRYGAFFKHRNCFSRLWKWNFNYKNKNKPGRKAIFFEKDIPKDIEIDETIKQSKYLKEILDKERKSYQIAKNCWLSRYKRSR